MACRLYLPPPRPYLTPEPKQTDTSVQTLWLHRPPPSLKARIHESGFNLLLRMCVCFLVRISTVYIWKVSPTVFSWLKEAKENARCSGYRSWNPSSIRLFLMHFHTVYVPTKPLGTQAAPYFIYREGLRKSFCRIPQVLYCRAHL